jgi:2Fe-2S ferredoxin
MANIIYITEDGNRHEVEVESGSSIMDGAVNNGIEGIVAECGGACACATCHSFIAPEWLDKIPEKDDMEEFMLENVVGSKTNSRLTCQVEVTDALDGLVVYVAQN